MPRLLAISALTGLAIAQPILDLLGGSPATFQVNRIQGGDIVWFAVAIVVVPPLLLWLVGEAVVAIDRRAGRMVHLGAVGVLCGIVGTLLAKEVASNAVVTLVSGLVVAVLAVLAYRRFEAFGMWVRVLSAANVLFLLNFVFLAPVSDWIGSGTQVAIALDADVDEPPASVVMLVFDEWPTQSILTEDAAVDELRFPNLAAFADEATWYRHFSAVSPFTQSAVPALLDGLDPHGEPTWTDHPDSLFSLLAGSHHLIVSESITQMCGFDDCGVRPVPPPPPDDIEVDEPVPADGDTGPRWGRIVDTAWEAWTDRVAPGRAESPGSFDDFQEEFTIVEQEPPAGENTGLDDDEIALERFLATLVDAQPNRHRLFVDALQPTDEPFFGYLHLILPHQPWTVREDGTQYEVAADRADFAADNDDPWPVRVTQQRHLLQTEYADRLLGVVLDRLTEIGEYEDTLVVVVGDHGVAFEAGESSRTLTEENLEQIAYAPLLIKAPQQRSSEIDDTNVNSTDVTPTIADMLGIELPWATDGEIAGSEEIENRGSGKYIYSYTDAFDYEFLGIVEYDDESAFDELMAGRFPPVGAGEERITGLYHGVPGSELIGRTPDAVFGPVVGSASVVDLDRLVDPGSGELFLGEIAGRVDDPPEGTTVIAAVNDRVVGVSPLYRRSGEDGSFVVLLPADALSPDTNSIRLGLRQADGTVDELSIDG